MKILVLNSGSSSVKFQVVESESEVCLAKGVVEKIGSTNALLGYTPTGGNKIKNVQEVVNHKAAVRLALTTLQNPTYGVIKDINEIGVVGHRVVHGGEQFKGPQLVTDEVLKELGDIMELAPLHNPHNVAGISAIEELLPEVPQVVVFDTSFHQGMPEHAYLYALPMPLYKKYGLRRYGFHGTSHDFVSARAVDALGGKREDYRIITCHLGNGASLAAIKGGVSIDTSMGFTPLEGLVMGTRCGDMDPAIVPFLIEKEEISPAEVGTLMNKASGLKGLSGVSNDCREIEEEAEQGNHQAEMALKIFGYRVKKYIGSYAAAMGGLDVIVFTGGIGEHSAEMRQRICSELGFLGIELDGEANQSDEGVVSKGRVKVMVIPTNEELQIARESKRVVADAEEGQIIGALPKLTDAQRLNLVLLWAKHQGETAEEVAELYNEAYGTTFSGFIIKRLLRDMDLI